MKRLMMVRQKRQDSSYSLPSGVVQGLGMGFPDLKSKKNGKQKVAKGESHVSEALGKLKEQTKEVVEGLESMTGSKIPPGGENLGSDAMMEDWVKQSEELIGSQILISILLDHLPPGVIFPKKAKETERYSCPYSFAALMTVMAVVQGVGFALCMERDWSKWKLGWNIRLLAVVFAACLNFTE